MFRLIMTLLLVSTQFIFACEEKNSEFNITFFLLVLLFTAILWSIPHYLYAYSIKKYKIDKKVSRLFFTIPFIVLIFTILFILFSSIYGIAPFRAIIFTILFFLLYEIDYLYLSLRGKPHA